MSYASILQAISQNRECHVKAACIFPSSQQDLNLYHKLYENSALPLSYGSIWELYCPHCHYVKQRLCSCHAFGFRYSTILTMHSLISKAVRRISGITAQTASTASGGVYEKAFNMRFHQKQKTAHCLSGFHLLFLHLKFYHRLLEV